MATRIQILIGHKLTAEVVVENGTEAVRLWSKYANLKYQRGLDIGGAVINDYDRPRPFDVRVGSYAVQ